jgi:hypothetical protein
MKNDNNNYYNIISQLDLPYLDLGESANRIAKSENIKGKIDIIMLEQFTESFANKNIFSNQEYVYSALYY